jgi:hypothetical protein
VRTWSNAVILMYRVRSYEDAQYKSIEQRVPIIWTERIRQAAARRGIPRPISVGRRADERRGDEGVVVLEDDPADREGAGPTGPQLPSQSPEKGEDSRAGEARWIALALIDLTDNV